MATPGATAREVPARRPAWTPLLAALILGLGVLGAGFLIGRGFEHGREVDRYVTVKGLAESLVKADLAVWPLRITATGNDLGRVQERIDADLATLTRFLTEKGIAQDAIQPQRVEVTDLLAQPYRPEGVGDNRFIVAQTVIVRTEQVDLVAELNRATGELVKQGVVLADTGGPSYLFTKLNDIKPGMLAEATRNAREAAEQFAADSGSTIAEIRRASQGVFEILPRDPTPGLAEQNQLDKKIRVVSTIEYRLSD
ncbi:MAG: SIMPL domain-containing protein [Geminicoccaceae bacterium]